MKVVLKLTVVLLITLLFVDCQQEAEGRPRPHMYPRIDFPLHAMVDMPESDCPFSAEIPEYAELIFRTEEEGEAVPHACWFDIEFDNLGATIHCSYYPIDEEKNFAALVADAFTMVTKHNVMANYREELELENGHGALGLIFDIKGPVASPYQFYLSDEEDHFLRGSLYFDEKVERDSVQDIIDFLKVDLEAFLSTVDFD